MASARWRGPVDVRNPLHTDDCSVWKGRRCILSNGATDKLRLVKRGRSFSKEDGGRAHLADQLHKPGLQRRELKGGGLIHGAGRSSGCVENCQDRATDRSWLRASAYSRRGRQRLRGGMTGKGPDHVGAVGRSRHA